MTGRKSAKVILILVFAALLASPVVYKRLAARREAANAVRDTTSALSRYGFYFEEVGQTSKANFTHQAPTLDKQLDHIMPQVASMGAGVSIVDFDRDGWSDIYVTNSGEGSKNALFRNMTDGSFKDVAADLGIADVNQPG
ncbi:MAG TPA: VCBS repeat-containing protein, partial [Pyrinomonadaceae bacterium]|nr:VCBS repeat-containing protein [Pyrinomonadaceae bacterium]